MLKTKKSLFLNPKSLYICVMRLSVQKIVSFFMLGVIFTVSTGMGFVEHSCQMTDDTAIVFSKKKSCCAAKKAKSTCSQATFKKSSCCEDKNIYVHIDMAGYSHKIQKFLSSTFIAAIHNFFTWATTLWIPKEETCQYGNSSPPKTGRETLTKKRTLQI